MVRDKALVLVFVLLGISSGFNVIQYSSHQKKKDKLLTVKDSLETVRHNIERELQVATAELNNFRGINSSMDKIILDANLKVDFYEHRIKEMLKDERDQQKLINRLRSELSYVKVLKKDLMHRVEALIEENKKLNHLHSDLKASNSEKDRFNSDLIQKLALASFLRAEHIQIKSFKKRPGGRLVSTRVARKTDCLEIEMTIPENPLVANGSKQVQVQIIDPNGLVVASVESSALAVVQPEGAEVLLTHVSSMNYNGKRESLTIKLDVPELIFGGVYLARIYIDGMGANTSEFMLR